MSEKIEKDIQIHNQSYKTSIYIDQDNLAIKLETNEKKTYFNQYKLEDLKSLRNWFKQYEEIKEVFDEFEYLIKEENNLSISENSPILTFIIKNVDRKKTNLEFTLHEEIKETTLEYSNLSEEMKVIIDKNGLILGIDLGTSYCCSSVMLDNNIIIIPNSFGKRTTPSFVSFYGKDKIIVGELAKLLPSKEKNIIYKTKSLLGKKLKDKEIQEIRNNLPFKLTEDEDSNLEIELEIENEKKKYYPEQISAMILKKIVKDSEFYLSKKLKKEIKINKAVITVPAYFNQKQRQATYIAAQIAGIEVERMINEPTAASLCYGFEYKENQQNHIIVIDFGGGTLDITLLEYIKKEKMENTYYQIKFTYGDTHFGGDNFDFALMKKCTINDNLEGDKIKLPHNIRLKRACEKAKIKLSSTTETDIILEEYLGKRIDVHVTRKDFEEKEDYCKLLFDKFETIINGFLKEVIKDKKIDENIKDIKDIKEKISQVLLIGGSTKIPKIKEIVEKIFSKEKTNDQLDPNESVAKGASIQGAIISNLKSVEKICFFDITNLSLGVNVKGEKMSKIIKRNTPIPYKCDEIYTTATDNQTTALIQIYEGENPDNKNNLFLGEFEISGLPKKKAKEAEIKIQFYINENSLLIIDALDLENMNNNEKKALDLKIIKEKGLTNLISQLKKEEEKNIYFDIEELIKMAKDYLEENKNKTKESTNYINEENEINEKNLMEKINSLNKIIECGYFDNWKVRELSKKIKEMQNKKINLIQKTKENIKKIEDNIKEMKIDFKYSLIKYEEEIYNNKNIKSFENLIKQTGRFIKNFDFDKMPKILLSYIMNYFERINEYEIKKNELNYENDDMNKYIEEIIIFILDEVYLYDKDLLCEIIEILKDSKQIYDKCISILIQNYYSLLRQKSFDIDKIYNEIKELKESNQENEYYTRKRELEEKELKELEQLYKKCLPFFGFINTLPKEIFYTEDYVKDYKIKIKVIQFLIDHNFGYDKCLDENQKYQLKNLIKEYEKCQIYEIYWSDLYKLIKINQLNEEKSEFNKFEKNKLLEIINFKAKVIKRREYIRKDMEEKIKRKVGKDELKSQFNEKIARNLSFIIEQSKEYHYISSYELKDYFHNCKDKNEIKEMNETKLLEICSFFKKKKKEDEIYIEEKKKTNRDNLPKEVKIRENQKELYNEIICTINFFISPNIEGYL